jgi:hypothetical protein
MRRTTVLIVSALLLAGCRARSAAPLAIHPVGAPSTTTTRTAVVPWLPLSPTHPTIPSRIVARRPDPSRAEAARPCSGADLVASKDGGGAAAGTAVDNVTFRLAKGRAACAVNGWPQVDVTTVEGTTVPGRHQRWSMTYHHPVLVTRRVPALLQLAWPSACYAESGHSSISMTYAGRTWVLGAGSLSRTCPFDGNRPLGSIGVQRFVPLHVSPAHRVTAYNSVRERLPRHLTLRGRQPMDFVVTLVARRDVALDPCPDYRIGDGTVPDRTYRLNCAAVPWHDAQGRPYLPAGRPVRFAMHAGGIAGTAAKYWWSIVAPGTPPSRVGLVRVR